MPSKPETAIADAIIAHVKNTLKGDCHKIIGARRGEPDLDGWFWWVGGYIHFKVEVKTPIGVASELQKKRIRVYLQAGYMAGFVRSVEEFDELLGAYLTGSIGAKFLGTG